MEAQRQADRSSDLVAAPPRLPQAWEGLQLIPHNGPALDGVMRAAGERPQKDFCTLMGWLPPEQGQQATRPLGDSWYRDNQTRLDLQQLDRQYTNAMNAPPAGGGIQSQETANAAARSSMRRQLKAKLESGSTARDSITWIANPGAAPTPR